MIWIIIAAAIIILDQYTKYLAASKLMSYPTLPLIKGVFHLTYVENRGAAFGILQNQRWFFVLMTIIILSSIIFYILRYNPKNRLLMLSLSMIIGGAIGNFIDRIRLGYVIDFFDFTLINYPVFNVADSFVVIGTILLSYYLLFQHDDKRIEA